MTLSSRFPRGSRCLVTGGTGFIGSHLVDRLVSMDCHVTVLDDYSNSTDHVIQHVSSLPRVSVVRASVSDCDVVASLVKKKFPYIFHLASGNLLGSIERPVSDLDVSARATLFLLSCLQTDSPHTVFVYSSTGSVYGEPKYQPQDEGHPLDPVSPYGVSKLAAETYVLLWHRLYALHTISLRYYNVYGPRQNYREKGGVVSIFIDRVMRGKPPIIEGTGRQERCFTYVSDVVEANILASLHPRAWGSAYNIGTSHVVTIRNLAGMILTAFSSDLSPVFARRRIGDIDAFRPKLTRARQRLGYTPRVSLRDGIDLTIAWFRTRFRDVSSHQREVDTTP